MPEQGRRIGEVAHPIPLAVAQGCQAGEGLLVGRGLGGLHAGFGEVGMFGVRLRRARGSDEIQTRFRILIDLFKPCWDNCSDEESL
jgi:hypothetical protein